MINGNVEYTSVDELIAKLKKLSKEGYGDYPVCVNGLSPVHVSGRQWYYDGGYLVKDANKGNYDYLRSRPRDGNIPHPDVKELCFDIDICDPTWSEEATIDGRTVREMNPETWTFLDKEEQEEKALFNGQVVQYRGSKERDPKMNCYPITAYLDSGESAIGNCAYAAKEKLKEQFAK